MIAVAGPSTQVSDWSTRYSHIAVARNLRDCRTGLTIGASMFRPRKNRRKVDLAKKTGEMKATVKSHAPSILKALGVTAVTIALGAGAVKGWGWATTTDRFALRAVRVVGNAHATDAQVWKLGGLVTGQNLFAMDTASVERALMAHPWIKSVSVRRSIPDELTVTVVEHQPVALISLGDLYLVDAEGEPFKRAQAAEAMDLPLVTGIEREALLEKRAEARDSIRAALAAAAAYSASPASKGHALSEVNVSDFGLTLVTTSGQELILGTSELQPALTRLERVRKELSARKLSAEVIRLDNRTRPNWVSVQTGKAQPPGGLAEKSVRTP